MDLHAFNQLDGRRLEVVVDGLPLWNGAQLAIDTTMVSPVRNDGTARAGTASINGKALDVARTRKARRYPELSGEHGRARSESLLEGPATGGVVQEQVQSPLKRGRFLREDFVPHTDEEFAPWMHARQSEMHAAIAAGHTSEVCRLAASTTLESWTRSPSNVSNVSAQADMPSMRVLGSAGW